MPEPFRTASQFNTATNPYVRDFTSVSGSDIIGIFGHVELLNLQGVSVSVNREVHPIYVMGRVDPVSFVRGKRGVAGSLVTVCSDRGALYDISNRYGVVARKVGDNRPGLNGPRYTIEENVLDESDRLGFDLIAPEYYDQLPPFDVTLVGRNQNMAATIARIGGVYIVSMGTGMSVDDNSIEQQMTFVSLFYEDWRPAGRTADEYAKAAESVAQQFGVDGRVDPFFRDDVPDINPEGIPNDTLGENFGVTGVANENA